jgi:hypothetical protein
LQLLNSHESLKVFANNEKILASVPSFQRRNYSLFITLSTDG